MDDDIFKDYDYCREYVYDYHTNKKCYRFSKLMYLLSISSKIDRNKILKYIATHKDEINKENKAGYTSLHFIAANGKILKNNDLIKTLIENGADVYCNYYDTPSPLILSLFRNNYQAAKKLLKNGCNVNNKNNIEYIYKIVETDKENGKC